MARGIAHFGASVGTHVFIDLSKSVIIWVSARDLARGHCVDERCAELVPRLINYRRSTSPHISPDPSSDGAARSNPLSLSFFLSSAHHLLPHVRIPQSLSVATQSCLGNGQTIGHDSKLRAHGTNTILQCFGERSHEASSQLTPLTGVPVQ